MNRKIIFLTSLILYAAFLLNAQNDTRAGRVSPKELNIPADP